MALPATTTTTTTTNFGMPENSRRAALFPTNVSRRLGQLAGSGEGFPTFSGRGGGGGGITHVLATRLALHGFFFFSPVSSVLRLHSSARLNAGGVSTCGSSEPRPPLATCRFDRNRRRICSREKNVREGPDELKAEGQENRTGSCATIVVDAFVSSCPLRLVWRPKKTPSPTPFEVLSSATLFPRGRCLRCAAVHYRRLVEVRGTSAAIYFVIFTAAATLR